MCSAIPRINSNVCFTQFRGGKKKSDMQMGNECGNQTMESERSEIMQRGFQNWCLWENQWSCETWNILGLMLQCPDFWIHLRYPWKISQKHLTREQFVNYFCLCKKGKNFEKMVDGYRVSSNFFTCIGLGFWSQIIWDKHFTSKLWPFTPGKGWPAPQKNPLKLGCSMAAKCSISSCTWRLRTPGEKTWENDGAGHGQSVTKPLVN